MSGSEHYLGAFTVGPGGELTPLGDAVKLKYRPIHSSVDIAGEYVLVAYNFPAGVTVHRSPAMWGPSPMTPNGPVAAASPCGPRAVIATGREIPASPASGDPVPTSGVSAGYVA